MSGTDIPFADLPEAERIEFVECDGTERAIELVEGDRSVGLGDYWEAADDEWIGLQQRIRELEEENLMLHGGVTMLQGLLSEEMPFTMPQSSALSALYEIANEFVTASGLHPTPMRSCHEGYAILREEVDELWDAIKQDEPWESVRSEAIQVGAMALRFLVDLCPSAIEKVTPNMSGDEAVEHLPSS